MASRRREGTKRRPAPKPSSPLPGLPLRGLRWRAAVLVLAGLLTYANSLSGAFLLDDQATIVDNPQIRALWPLAGVLSPEPGSSASGRPLVSLSFAINYALGGLDVRGYHAWNIAVHIACALVLFGIVRRTLNLPKVRSHIGDAGTDLAFAIALVWTVHSLNTEAVDYLTQRSESMVALCLLLTLYAAIRSAGPIHSRVWRGAAVAACVFGTGCKESIVVAPLVVVLFDRAFLVESWRQALRARGLLYVGLASAWLALAVLNASGPRSEVVGFSTGVSWWTYLLNQTVMLATYARLAVWPRSLVVFYGWPLPLAFGDVWPHALVVTLVFVAVLAGVLRASMLAFPGAWFFLTLAPTSSIVPIATEVGAERRMYLPLMALVALAVVGFYASWQVVARRWIRLEEPLAQRAAAIGGTACLVALCGWLAATTIARNREYASALTMARTVVERRPTSVAHHILAEQLIASGLHEEGVTHLRQAVALGDSRAGFLLGVELFNAGKLNEALEQLDVFTRTWGLPYRLVPHWLEPLPAEVVTALLGMSRAFAIQARWAQSAERAQRILAMAPGHVEARVLLANALFGQQRFAEASREYREYLKAKPDDARALMDFGVSMVAGGQLVDAIAAFRRVVEIEPQNPGARRVLGMALLDHGDVDEGMSQAREALSLRPDDQAIRELVDRAESMARGAGVARRPRS